LTLPESELKKLTSFQCIEAAFILTREALYLQQQINQNHAKINYCNTHIDMEIKPLLDNYNKYLPYTQKRTNAINDNERTKKFAHIVLACHTQNELMSYLPTYLRALAETLIEFSKFKKTNQGLS